MRAQPAQPPRSPTTRYEEAGHPIYWDPVTESAWTAYQVGNQWHETFFDDPTSMYQIALLAGQYGLGGVGMWALGATGTDPTMVSALEGKPPTIQYATPPTPSTTTTTTSSTTPPSASASSVPLPASGSNQISGTPGTPTTSEAGGATAGAAPSVPAASFTGTFETESLANIEGDTSILPSSPVALQSVNLCLVPLPPSKSAACAAPYPASSEPSEPASAYSTASTAVAPVLTPPFPGATVVGVLSGIAVTNDAALSCLETDNQLAGVNPSTADTTPKLVVWQVPNDQQYYYVAMTTTPTGSEAADCANATLAFPAPPQATPTPG